MSAASRSEWKLNEHDEPADLADRLRAAGFVPEDRETVVVGPVAPLAAALPVVPEGVRLREVTAREDLERIAAMEEEVWQAGPFAPRVTGLAKEIDADPHSITVVVAEAGGTVVSAGWVRYPGEHRLRHAVGWLDPAAVAAQGHLPGAGQLPGAAGRPAGPDADAGRLFRGQPADPGAARPRPGHHHHPVRLHSVIMEQRLTDEERLTLKTGAFGAVFLVSNADPGCWG